MSAAGLRPRGAFAPRPATAGRALGRLAAAGAALLVLALTLAGPASANTCAPAAVQGTAPSDYQDYCWLDFTGYADATAQTAGGQNFTFALPDGSTLSLTLKVSTNKTSPALAAVAVPSWSGAAFGNSAFRNIPGLPVLYEKVSGSTVDVTLSNISVMPPAGSGGIASYAIIAADGESTNQNESLSFTTNGQAWVEVAQIPNGGNYPTVAGTGTLTVTETGRAGTVGSFAFASFNNPTQISSVLVGGGLQGVLFGIRYASIAVNAALTGTRASASDQFTYGIATTGGTTLASGTSTGSGAGPFSVATVPTVAAGYPFVISESMAPGSASTLAYYAVSLTCTNSSTGGSSTVLPVKQSLTTYTFPTLQYGDAVSCLFTNTANRANLAVTKSGPATVNAGSSFSYTLVASNGGPLAANGAVVTDAAVANFTATSVSCSAATGSATCPVAGLTVANLEGAGIALPALPSGGTVTLVVTGTAAGAAGSISNTARIAAPVDLTNSNATPTSTVVTTITTAADVAATATFPPTVNAGQPVSGTVQFTNNGPDAAAGTTFTLALPAGLATAPVLTGLPAGAGYSYATATGVVTLTGMPASLAAGAGVGPVTIAYTQPASGTSTVTTSVATTTNDPNPANNTATATVAGSPVADLAASATFPASVPAGQPVSGTVRYTNNGPSTASTVVFTLTLPATLAATPTLSGLPAGATFSYAPATGVVTLAGMPTSLASGASVGPVTIGYTQPGVGNSVVVAAVTSATLDPNPANNTATANVSGTTAADLSAAATFPASVNAGQPVAGSVTFANAGPSTALAISFTLTLPANLASPPTLGGLPAGATYSYAPGTGVVTLAGMPASLAAGASIGPISIAYTQPPSGSSAVTAAVSSSTTDPNPGNNSAAATVAGHPVADVGAAVAFPANVNAGGVVAGTVTFSNAGPSTAAGTTFTLTLPANLASPPTLAGLPAGASYGYAPASGVVTLNGMPATLAAGASTGPIRVSYSQPAAATSTVTAAVASTTLDPNAGNNSATATVGGSPVADLGVSAAFPASVNAGATVAGSITVTNLGPSAASGISLTLTLPANLPVPPSLAGLPAGAGYHYAPATGVITFTGLPATLAAGATLGPIEISYPQSAAANTTVSAAVAATTLDPNPANNTTTAHVTGMAGQLTGTVYVDVNQDGEFDAGDRPVAGATVELLAGTRVVATTTTGANGSYQFAGQPAGSYRVVYTPPAGQIADTPGSVAVTLGGATPSLVNFGQVAAASLGSLIVTKTTPLVNITAGQSVPYTITVTNPGSAAVTNVTVTDLMPAGFRFRAGSGLVNGRRLDPAVSGRDLSWTHQTFAPGAKITFGLVLTPGSGVVGGEYVNQAGGYSGLTGTPVSNLATATVRIVADPTFDCPDLIGKVFDDANENGVLDPGEKGIAGVRLVTAQGLLVTTDAEGRYHITCPVLPDTGLGVNFIVKVDERTLPSGYRLTTDNPETVRLTAGKVTKLNFGASIHRVVRIEVSARAFEGTALDATVAARIAALVATLRDEAVILRLAYEASGEPEPVVAARLAALKDSIAILWKANDCRHPLRIEEDIVRSRTADPAASGEPR